MQNRVKFHHFPTKTCRLSQKVAAFRDRLYLVFGGLAKRRALQDTSHLRAVREGHKEQHA